MSPVDVALNSAPRSGTGAESAALYFVSVPDEKCAPIQDVANEVTYGWGMIPATVTVGDTTWPTALWPKNGTYVVPLKAWVRKAEGIEDGETIEVSWSSGALARGARRCSTSPTRLPSLSRTKACHSSVPTGPSVRRRG